MPGSGEESIGPHRAAVPEIRDPEIGERGAADKCRHASPACKERDMKRLTDINDNSIGAVREAAFRAFRGHKRKPEVRAFLSGMDIRCEALRRSLEDGTWKERLSYRRSVRVNRNGKVRRIDEPSLETRILQHHMLNLLEPVYGSKDNLNGLNCKEGCGITAADPRKSVVRRLKRLFYDRRDLRWCLVIDQRQCYAHVTEKAFRRELKRMVADRGLVDFAVGVSFTEGRLPIGTPASPFVHHVLMLGFDHFARTLSPYAVRYADDNLLAFATKEEAQAAKWRVKNFWWYRLGIRAKRHTVCVRSLDEAIDFCGFVFRRNPEGRRDKGYVTVRRDTLERAVRCRTDKSWASWFGQMKHADCYGLMRKTETRMKLRQLTEKIRIDRRMDARHIDVRDLCGTPFTIYDYEVRYNGQKEPNWIKCLVGVDEISEGERTGRTLAYEFHGNYQNIIRFILECERAYGKKALLPLEEMELENQCGYIFKGSTNQFKYIDEHENGELH